MRIVLWIRKLFGYIEPEDIDFGDEQLPDHVKEFMKKK